MSKTWLDEEDQGKPTRERDDRDTTAPPDLDPRSMVVSPPPRDSGDLAELCRVAREAPPRDPDRIRTQAALVGAQLGGQLDERGEGTGAYYRWTARGKKGPSVIEGPTIGLMDALVSVWGRVMYSTRIVAEVGPRVTFRSRAVDLLAIVPFEADYQAFLRDPPQSFEGEERERWRVMQLQAGASKAVRGVLEHLIPSWVQNIALDAAYAEAARVRTGGRPLGEASAAALRALLPFGVGPELAVAWVGAPIPEWTAYHLQELRGVYLRLSRSEITIQGLAQEAVVRTAARKADEAPATDPSNPLGGLGLAPKKTDMAAVNRGEAANPGQVATETKAPAADAKKAPAPADPASDAAVIRAAIPPTLILSHERARTALKAAAGLQALRDSRYDAAIAHGVTQGWWQSGESGITGAREDWADPGVPTGDELMIALTSARTVAGLERADRFATELGIDADSDEPALRRYLGRLTKTEHR